MMTLINRIATTEKGWTDDITCCEWFRKTFIPQATARRENPEETIVLLLDNHASHKTPEMLRLAIEHNIEFVYLPPHTTHQLQPLDVGVFGPLQRKWQERCDDIITETNTEVPRSRFVAEYMNVRNGVFTKELIQNAWKKAGAWPWNPRNFTEKDFAPSRLMSYAARLPQGYPEPPEAPDMLVFAQESEDDEMDTRDDDGPGGKEMDESSDSRVHETTNGDNEMDEGSDGDNESDENDGGDDSEDDEMDGGETGDGSEPDANGGRGMTDAGEMSGDAMVGETDTPSGESHLPRYGEESYHPEQLVFTYP